MNQNELQKRLIRYQGETEKLSYWLGGAKQSLPDDFEGYGRLPVGAGIYRPSV